MLYSGIQNFVDTIVLHPDSWAMVALTLALVAIAAVQIYRESAKVKIEITLLVFLQRYVYTSKHPFYQSNILKFKFKSPTPYTESSRSISENGTAPEQYNSRLEVVEIKVLNNSTKNPLHFKYPIFRLYKKYGLFNFRYTVKSIAPLNMDDTKEDIALAPGESITFYYPSFYFLDQLNLSVQLLPQRVSRTIKHVNNFSTYQKKYWVNESKVLSESDPRIIIDHKGIVSRHSDFEVKTDTPQINDKYIVKVGIEKIFSRFPWKYSWQAKRVLERGQTSFLKNVKQEPAKEAILVSNYVEEFFGFISEYNKSIGRSMDNKKEIHDAANIALKLAVEMVKNMDKFPESQKDYTAARWNLMNPILDDKNLLTYLSKNYFSSVQMMDGRLSLGNPHPPFENEIDEPEDINTIE